MDQGVVEKMKGMYKKDVLRRLLLAEDEEGVIIFLKKLNLKDCCYMVADAWNTLTPMILRKAWNKLVGEIEDEENVDVNEAGIAEDLDEITNELFPRLPGFTDCDQEDARGWLTSDSDAGFHIFNDDEIVSTVLEESKEDNENESSNYED